MAAHDTPSTGLTKKDKGRWKKLRKRAIRNDDATSSSSNGLSGLTVKEDWVSLQDYYIKSSLSIPEHETLSCPFGPSVCLRKHNHHNINNETSDQVAEGLDHRDILATLLLRPNTATATTSNNKKRARDDDDNITADSFSIPAWATLQNPVCLEHVAVIQVHLEQKAASLDWERLFQELDVLNPPCTTSRLAMVKTQTRWFQGPSPKSITESLLYLLRDNKQNPSTNPKQVTSMEQLVPLVEDLVLSEQKRVEEGYPMVDTTAVASEAPVGDLILPLVSKEGFQLSSLDEAKAIVDQYKLDGVTNVEEDDRIANYVETQPHHRQVDGSTMPTTIPRILALDCEMVKTKAGNELARVTLVQLDSWEADNDDESNDDHGRMKTKVVLDEWVQPYHQVLDYLTEYSGATARILNQTSTRLEQIQAALLQLIDRNDILIGHSLENDLKAARLVHHRVVDTSVLFRVGRRGCKFSLKHLAATLLKRRIQSGNHHCSEEDAVTAMHLALQRARFGPSFGIRNRTAIPLLDTFSTQGVTVAIGPAAWLEEHVTRQPNGIHALACESVGDGNAKALLAWLTGPKRRARMVLSNLVVSKEAELKTLNKLLVDLTDSMSPTTVVLVAFQRGFKDAKTLATRRKACQDPRSTCGWTGEEETKWEQVLETCRSGPAIWIGAANREAAKDGP